MASLRNIGFFDNEHHKKTHEKQFHLYNKLNEKKIIKVPVTTVGQYLRQKETKL